MKGDNRNAMLDARAEYNEQSEYDEQQMDDWYEQQDADMKKYYEDEVKNTMQDEFNKRIQELLEYTSDTCGYIRDNTQIIGADDDVILIKKCLVNLENFDIDFNGPEIEYYTVVMSGTDIISMNDIATTSNMMSFMEKYFEELDDTCYNFITEVSMRRDALYDKLCGSDYIMIRYVPKWKLAAEIYENKRDEDMWIQHCDIEREIERLWDILSYKEEEIRQEKIRQAELADNVKSSS